MSVSLHLQAFSGFDGVTSEWTVQPTSYGPGPFETYPSSIVFFTMTSVAFPKSIFSELAANLPRHACRTGESITMSPKGMWIGFRSAVPELALLLIVTVTGAASATAATTHYIAANGSDSSNGPPIRRLGCMRQGCRTVRKLCFVHAVSRRQVHLSWRRHLALREPQRQPLYGRHMGYKQLVGHGFYMHV